MPPTRSAPAPDGRVEEVGACPRRAGCRTAGRRPAPPGTGRHGRRGRRARRRARSSSQSVSTWTWLRTRVAPEAIVVAERAAWRAVSDALLRRAPVASVVVDQPGERRLARVRPERQARADVESRLGVRRRRARAAAPRRRRRRQLEPGSTTRSAADLRDQPIARPARPPRSPPRITWPQPDVAQHASCSQRSSLLAQSGRRIVSGAIVRNPRRPALRYGSRPDWGDAAQLPSPPGTRR